jgi:hypothetical protein
VTWQSPWNKKSVPIPRYPSRGMQELWHTTNAGRQKCLAVQPCMGTLKRPPRLSTYHIKDVCSSCNGACCCSCFVQEKRGKRFMEAPPLVLSEICLNPEFASTAVTESHAPPSSSSFPFRVFFLFPRPSRVLHSSICQLQAVDWHFFGPRDPLARSFAAGTWSVTHHPAHL